jgi:hypothetical protein
VKTSYPPFADSSRFRHAVTKRRSRIEYPETGGGMLLDEMGMGKTLSILALVTKTLEEAHKWTATDTGDDSEIIIPTKKRAAATLVIVPSARKPHSVQPSAMFLPRPSTHQYLGG